MFPGSAFSIVYHGSITPDRVPRTLIDAVAQLPEDISLTIVGYETIGTSGYLVELKKHAARLKIDHRLHIDRPLSRHDLMAQCARHDLGLCLLPIETADVNMGHMVGASNKVFDYLAAGLPVLVPNTPSWITTFVVPGYGVACDPSDPRDIARSIHELYVTPGRCRSMAAAGQDRIRQDWNYETQFQPVLQHLLTG
jgi:glycosyltransferase involved in cell wall biosynthesis